MFSMATVASAGELLAEACAFGIPHPPGYPFLTLASGILFYGRKVSPFWCELNINIEIVHQPPYAKWSGHFLFFVFFFFFFFFFAFLVVCFFALLFHERVYVHASTDKIYSHTSPIFTNPKIHKANCTQSFLALMQTKRLGHDMYTYSHTQTHTHTHTHTHTNFSGRLPRRSATCWPLHVLPSLPV